MIIDTHCHLDYFDEIESVNIINRALQNNVHKMITISTEIDKIDQVI